MISQREAHRLRREVERMSSVFDAMLRNWRGEWPDATVIGRVENAGCEVLAIVETARRLKHAVVVTRQGRDLVFYGSELPKP